MTSVSLQERLEEATADLSRCQVASDVAEILRVEGVQGKRSDCKRCPVAALMVKRLHLEWVRVSFGDIEVRDATGASAQVAWSDGVEAFVGEFDEEDSFFWDEFAVASP